MVRWRCLMPFSISVRTRESIFFLGILPRTRGAEARAVVQTMDGLAARETEKRGRRGGERGGAEERGGKWLNTCPLCAARLSLITSTFASSSLQPSDYVFALPLPRTRATSVLPSPHFSAFQSNRQSKSQFNPPSDGLTALAMSPDCFDKQVATGHQASIKYKNGTLSRY